MNQESKLIQLTKYRIKCGTTAELADDAFQEF